MTIVALAELLNRVQNLDSIDNWLDEGGIRKRYLEENAKLTIGDEVPLFIFNPESPLPVAGQNLYRTTRHFPGFQESEPSFYKQPPKGLTRQQRCNLPKHPVFYCSDLLGICLFEVIQGISTISGEYFYFSEWEVLSNRKWRVLSFIFSGIPKTNPAYSYIIQKQPDVFKKFENFMSPNEVQAYIDFYHAEFTREGSHKFSSVVSHQFLHENDQGNGDFVFYPSVQGLKEANNFAFNENVIESGEIVLRKVYKVYIDQLTKTSASSIAWIYALKSVGEVIGIQLQWRDPDKNDNTQFDNHFLSVT
jgi:hypothetical protein